MKKGILILLAMSMTMAISFGTLVFAEEEMPEMGGPGKGKAGMMGMMHKNSLVATSDGGVVVLSGPRLLKYDQNLTLIQEVELPRGKKPGSQEMKSEIDNPEQTGPSY